MSDVRSDLGELTYEQRRNRTHARSCGDCKLCCKLPAVAPINKPAGVWCEHAKSGRGCAIYATRPGVCQAYACMWLAEPENTQDWLRPDKAHFIVEEGVDVVGINGHDFPAIQVYADPGYPSAWRNNEQLRKFISRAAAKGMVTLVRYNPERGAVVLAPPLVPRWIEQEAPLTVTTTLEHKRAVMARHLAR